LALGSLRCVCCRRTIDGNADNHSHEAWSEMRKMNMASNKMLRTTLPTACLLLLGVGIAACGGDGGSLGENTSSTENALGSGGGPQACLIGTHSLRLGQRVTTVGGLATNALSIESGAVANGDANINNTTTSQVRISGATIKGNVQIAGAAPSAANGELINGGTITGTVTPGSAQQSVLPSHAVPVGTANVTINPGNPPTSQILPGNYAAVTVNGSKLTFKSGTFNLSSLVVNSGAQIVFDTSTGPVDINVQGSINLNGAASVVGTGLVSLYGNSSSSNAVTINAGVGKIPATITAPNGGVAIGSRNTVVGCVGAKDVTFEPDSHISQ
jgi:hypothetical protein